MATREQLIEASKKALLSPDIGKRGKSKNNIAIEDARKVWAEQQLKHLPELAQVQSAEALKPENRQEREYVLNQLLGKATESVELSGKDGEAIPVSIIGTMDKIYGDRNKGD